VLYALVLLLAGSGCQARLAVDVTVHGDGSGRIEAGLGLDDDALAELGDPAQALALDDLRTAGWEVRGPRREGDGRTWVRVAKGFADPGEAGAVAAELGGTGGILGDLTVTSSGGVLRRRTTLTGTVDLTAGLGTLADPGLADVVGEVPIGLGVDDLRRRFGEGYEQAVEVEVTADLPGERRVWRPQLGEVTTLALEARGWRLVPAVPGALALAFALVAVSAATAGPRRRARVRRRRRRMA